MSSSSIFFEFVIMAEAPKDLNVESLASLASSAVREALRVH